MRKEAFSALIAVVMVPGALANVIVVPNQYTSAPGPWDQTRPFNAGPDPMRMQQVYAASQFGGVSGQISQIAYRVDEVVGSAFGPVQANVRVSFSHTTKAPHGLDGMFDNNVGGDALTVLNSVVTLSSSGSGFDVVLDVADTFTYNGTSNLLLDMWFSAPVALPAMDAAAPGDQTTSLIWGYGGTFGTNLGSQGLITQFTIVPEPATLCALGLGLGVLLRRKRSV